MCVCVPLTCGGQILRALDGLLAFDATALTLPDTGKPATQFHLIAHLFPALEAVNAHLLEVAGRDVRRLCRPVKDRLEQTLIEVTAPPTEPCFLTQLVRLPSPR